ncbi:hypothetical protein BH762_gp116 [Gordonia phage OneUp]|uniref:Uncharacterized protein n=1 Tax=Gordonia phage OneUp TaxID=1838074 RepID=A0A166Y962_9CAUD|nr:hypothetical protein BH762_gp116 [Gordonia phage OneUp]ANA86403.1 hypothetical protein PBI_ONEUP_68 [Gordonia phage OneUp]
MAEIETPSSLRAQEISDALRAADLALAEAGMHLRKAVTLAEADYEHNDEKPRDLLAVAKLLRGLTCVEYLNWDGYARARRQR